MESIQEKRFNEIVLQHTNCTEKKNTFETITQIESNTIMRESVYTSHELESFSTTANELLINLRIRHTRTEILELNLEVIASFEMRKTEKFWGRDIPGKRTGAMCTKWE